MRVEPGSLHLQSLPYHTKPPPPTTTLTAHDLSHILSHSLLNETLSYTLGPKLQHSGLTALTPAIQVTRQPVSTLTIQAPLHCISSLLSSRSHSVLCMHAASTRVLSQEEVPDHRIGRGGARVRGNRVAVPLRALEARKHRRRSGRGEARCAQPFFCKRDKGLSDLARKKQERMM